ncbi:MAG: DUF368 domain-containing protein [Erysipelotrichales bacterium]|nr:DUF368 domain-containing protein [Erysipelotrichales bacterium]
MYNPLSYLFLYFIVIHFENLSSINSFHCYIYILLLFKVISVIIVSLLVSYYNEYIGYDSRRDIRGKAMMNFLKGIIVGIGGISPGLSGSVLLIIFGLYQKALEAISTLFTHFKENILFLFPLVTGMGVGVLSFSNILDHLLEYYEMPTRFAFLGLILGTIPLLWKEVTKKDFSTIYYYIVIVFALLGTWAFTINSDSFEQIHDPTWIQSIILGVLVVATAIIPGIDPAVTLSTFGYYEVYVSALADIDLSILLPMLIGVIVGGIVISYIMTRLFNRWYTATFSVIFGLFLSMIPNMLNESCVLGLNGLSVISIVVMILGFGVSYYLGTIESSKS